MRQAATFAGGCFWCTEAVFMQLKGVEKVISGYTGGTVKNPSYKEVCTGKTGHAEAIEIHFNPDEISYAQLLEVFFAVHDPTTLNRQGNDIGEQYRSAVFYHTEEQRQQAQDYIDTLQKEQIYPDAIVTGVTQASAFYPAEQEHSNYFNLHKEQPYCNLVINPKIQKFKKNFKDRLKT